ncbi:MAG: hypothetical protein KGJ62_02300 [Armatimonadetes bacterium]|nr:hypothetical protein [Armatimonadota bacterium]MDE2205348.1 hypothetical protein [Armatimonadota bacterium]
MITDLRAERRKAALALPSVRSTRAVARIGSCVVGAGAGGAAAVGDVAVRFIEIVVDHIPDPLKFGYEHGGEGAVGDVGDSAVGVSVEAVGGELDLTSISRKQASTGLLTNLVIPRSTSAGVDPGEGGMPGE